MSKLDEQASRYLSDIRMYRYNEIALSHCDKETFSLYINNLQVSKEILGIIALFEIILKNKVNSLLKSYNYLDKTSNILSCKSYNLINKAKKDMHKKGRVPAIQDSRIVSLLTFGFWVTLFEDDKLWSKSLSKIFDKETRKLNSITSGKIRNKLRKIVNLRNKIAHHERIIFKNGLNIIDTIQDIVEITSWLISEDDKQFKECVIEEMLKVTEIINNIEKKEE